MGRVSLPAESNAGTVRTVTVATLGVKGLLGPVLEGNRYRAERGKESNEGQSFICVTQDITPD